MLDTTEDFLFVGVATLFALMNLMSAPDTRRIRKYYEEYIMPNIDWAPSGMIFGIVWLLLEIAAVVGASIFWHTNKMDASTTLFHWTMLAYIVSYVPKVFWTRTFFNAEDRSGRIYALILCILALAFIVAFIILFAYATVTHWLVYVCFIAQAAWLLYATALNWASVDLEEGFEMY